MSVNYPRPVPVAVPQPEAQIILRPAAVPTDRPVPLPISQVLPVTVIQGVGIPVPQPYVVSVPTAVPVRVPESAVGGYRIGAGGYGTGVGGYRIESGVSICSIGSGFPFSLDNIPRQTQFACLSLKVGSIISAFILILYSIFALAQCLAALNVLPVHWTPDDMDVVVSYGVVIGVTIAHTVTLFLSTLMLVGVLKEKAKLMKPWVIWTSLQVMVSVLVFVFWSTLGMINHYNESSLMIYVLEFLGLMVRFYMLMIVSSFYRQLEERKMEETERLRDLVNNENWYNTA
ncbi:unnamed protein product [Euphydryas editha]|uniref:Uncharacterized protein n=1 Tax=Euphydryas editha TaxID=104508 RepID=A0AAU9TSK5_EUPED|nr:unnamed protein product [Euphydryas editha]